MVGEGLGPEVSEGLSPVSPSLRMFIRHGAEDTRRAHEDTGQCAQKRAKDAADKECEHEVAPEIPPNKLHLIPLWPNAYGRFRFPKAAPRVVLDSTRNPVGLRMICRFGIPAPPST